MKKIWILAPVVAILAVVSWWGIKQLRDYARTNDAFIDGYSAIISSDLSPLRIISLEVDEGSVVKKGDLLCTLDPSFLLSQKMEAQAKIISTETEVVLQRYHFEKVRNDFGRAEQAFADSVISSQQFDHAQKNLGIAQAALDQAIANFELAKTELGVIEENLRHTLLVAPRDGVISKRWVLAGDVMQPGQAIFSLYDLESVWVQANLEETEMEHIRIGDPVEISIDAYPGYTFKGKIFVIKGAAASQFSLIPQNNATGNYTKVAQRVPLKITLEPPEELKAKGPLYLFPGMSAEVKIHLRK